MKLEIREFQNRDQAQAIAFAIQGMHFDWYFDNDWMLRLYGRYFWYAELTRATQVLAAYEGDRLAGVLLCAVRGERPACRSVWKSCYIGLFRLAQRLFAKGGAGVYDEANRQMLEHYLSNHAPDGEILFLAADPGRAGQGIGSFLLEELARREKGKLVYLYTDEGCTYQFYEHRGFERAEERDISLTIGKKTVDLRCFLYSKGLQ